MQPETLVLNPEAHVAGPLPGLAKKWCSRAAWLWGSATISSRTMYVPFDAAGALTPFGDMHNYVALPPSQPPAIPGAARTSLSHWIDCLSNTDVSQAEYFTLTTSKR